MREVLAEDVPNLSVSAISKFLKTNFIPTEILAPFTDLKN